MSELCVQIMVQNCSRGDIPELNRSPLVHSELYYRYTNATGATGWVRTSYLSGKSRVLILMSFRGWRKRERVELPRPFRARRFSRAVPSPIGLRFRSPRTIDRPGCRVERPPHFVAPKTLALDCAVLGQVPPDGFAPPTPGSSGPRSTH